jgi:hypothetical protein
MSSREKKRNKKNFEQNLTTVFIFLQLIRNLFEKQRLRVRANLTLTFLLLKRLPNFLKRLFRLANTCIVKLGCFIHKNAI